MRHNKANMLMMYIECRGTCSWYTACID